MISRLLALFAAAVPLWATASGAIQMPSRTLETAPARPTAFRAESLAPREAASLQALEEKTARAAEEPSGRLRIGTVRALPKAARVDAWTKVAGGFVARLRTSSEGALGLRAKLDLGSLSAAIEARVQGADGRIEFMRIEPAAGSEAWLPWTEGSSQVIELFSSVEPSEDAVRLGEILHFTESPFAKAAASCTVPTLCTTNDPVLDAAIAERKRSVVKLTFVDNGSGFACSATLINSERFPAPFILTANHCIDNAASASSVTTLWFYESVACDNDAVNPGYVQVSGGAQLVFGSYNVDSTLLRMNLSPPAGAVYASWNRARLAQGAPIVSLSHPRGDTSRYALGNISQEYRIVGHAQDMYGVLYSRGIIEGGSSGSGLFTLNGGTLQLRGILSGTTIRQGGLSCTTTLVEEGLYGRFEIFQPQIDQYIRTAPQAADDAPNRAQDLFLAPVTDPNGVDMPLNLRSSPLVFSGRSIDYAGDVDVYRFTLTQSAIVTIGTEGTIDTVGSLLDSRGVNIESNDDVANGNLNFGISRSLSPGTYYVLVSHWDADGTGAYGLRLATTAVPPAGPNYTDLWWNANESGWGINLNHQGNTVLATLYTYAQDGTAMWLIMSQGARQADGSYFGTLYRTNGPAFNATPFTPITPANYTTVGTMRLTFSGADAGILTYTVNGSTVTKNITRLAFSTPTTCTWSTDDRSTANNYQDLWWNANESGWGVNVTHHGNTMVATLFTYDSTGRGMWLIMSNGQRMGNRLYSGPLYRTAGPAFDSANWSATPIEYTNVGMMSFQFLTGNSGILTYSVNGVQVMKSISRLTFAPTRPLCSP